MVNMKKMVLASLLLAGVIFTAQAQSAMWQTLSKVTYQKKYDELLGFKVDVPIFSAETKALNNRQITIKGYIIPVEGYKGQKEFIFSAFPYNMCFFCGGAGPETVMEVFARLPIPYTTEAITIKGRLELNDADPNRLMYILHDAEKVD